MSTATQAPEGWHCTAGRRGQPSVWDQLQSGVLRALSLFDSLVWLIRKAAGTQKLTRKHPRPNVTWCPMSSLPLSPSLTVTTHTRDR